MISLVKKLLAILIISLTVFSCNAALANCCGTASSCCEGKQASCQISLPETAASSFNLEVKPTVSIAFLPAINEQLELVDNLRKTVRFCDLPPPFHLFVNLTSQIHAPPVA